MFMIVLFNFNVIWLNREKFSFKFVIENLSEFVLDLYKMKDFLLIFYCGSFIYLL